METYITNQIWRLNPLNDFLFFKVLGEKGDEVQLLSFLNAVLGRSANEQLVNVEILENKSFFAELMGDKTCILDVRAMLQDGTKINIEVQLRNNRNMDKRSLFYWSREFVKSLDSGQDYIELPKVIAINIVDFEFLASENFHSVFHLREDSENSIILTEALEIHFIDMVKWRRLTKKDIEKDALHRWLAWLDQRSPPELIKELKNMDNAIDKADERMVYVTGDKEAIRAYEMRMMGLSDWNSAKNYERREGLKEGREEGIKEIARKMKARGRPVEEIAEDTSLTVDEIKNL